MELKELGGFSGNDIHPATFTCRVEGTGNEILQLREIILNACDNTPFINVAKRFYKIEGTNINNYKIIFNPPATILFKDGKKYVAKCHPHDEFDEMLGLQVALLKSFGIKYVDLQEMLKGATMQKKFCNMSAHKVRQMKAKAKIEEVDVKEGKSYTTSSQIITDKIIVNGNELCVGLNIENGNRFWVEEPSRTYVGTNWTNFIPKPKCGRPRKSTTTTTTKRPVGRPKKVKTEEQKPKRPVGRPRKVKSQEIEAGDFVRVLKSASSPHEEIDKMIGRVCEVFRVDKFHTGRIPYDVYQEDKSDWWSFSQDELELVKKGDKHEK